MSRIQRAFAHAASEGRPALIAYLCAGDPSLEATEALMLKMAEAGADVIEVGVPFSDPTADGPVIQRASERALKAGTTLRGVLEMVGRVRTRAPSLPLVLFGYANPILGMGEEVFLDAMVAHGVDGLLAVDLPFDEAVSLREGAARRSIDWIPLIAPNTPPQRMVRIGEAASSFVYFISVAGVTGAASVDFEGAARRAKEVSLAIGKPVAVGFGVRTEADARALAKGGVDGVVVGSALVKEVEDSWNLADAEERVGALLASLLSGLRSR